MIEAHSFGRMVIDGVTCRKDVMILPDGEVVSPWWRETESHTKAQRHKGDVGTWCLGVFV